MANEDIQNLLKSGIEAARGGNRAVARRIFEQVIRQDAQNELAWMWLATVLENPAERRQALEKVLSLNPNNQRARQALDKLQTVTDTGRTAGVKPAPTTPPIPEKRPVVEELRPSARSSSPSFLYIFALAVASALIIAAVVWLVIQSQEEDEADSTPTRAASRPTVIATLPPPTAPIRTAAPGQAEGVALGPTWTPSPTETELPTNTPSPTLVPLSAYEIIFASADSPVGLRQLYTANADGSNVALLEINLDSSQLTVPSETTPQVFVATETPISEATTQEASTEPTPASNTSDGLYENLEFLEPALSSDGDLLAFSVQIAPDVQEIFVMSLPNGAPRQITTLGGAETGGAVWSANGQLLAFHSNADGDFDVYIYDTNDETVVNLTSENEFNERDPAFDPTDNARLIIASDQATPGELEIWTLPLGSGTPEQLTNATNSSFSPAFSADGALIAFISNRGGDNDVFVMNRDGSNEKLVSLNDGNADDFNPSWSPDSQWILVTSEREEGALLQLWAASPDGTQWVKITGSTGPSQDGVWGVFNVD